MSNEKKKTKEKIIYQGCKSATHFSDNRYRWGEVLEILKKEKIELRDDDILEIGFVEGYDHGDSSRDNMFDLTVIRFHEETDVELEERLERKYRKVAIAKEQRFRKYKELKNEFDNE